MIISALLRNTKRERYFKVIERIFRIAIPDFPVVVQDNLVSKHKPQPEPLLMLAVFSSEILMKEEFPLFRCYGFTPVEEAQGKVSGMRAIDPDFYASVAGIHCGIGEEIKEGMPHQHFVDKERELFLGNVVGKIVDVEMYLRVNEVEFTYKVEKYLVEPYRLFPDFLAGLDF